MFQHHLSIFWGRWGGAGKNISINVVKSECKIIMAQIAQKSRTGMKFNINECIFMRELA